MFCRPAPSLSRRAGRYWLLAAAAVSSLASTASAHFLFVVPEQGGGKASVILSEDLTPDDGVNVKIIGGAKLFLRDSAGKETPLSLTRKDDHAFTVDVAGGDGKAAPGTRVLRGQVDMGVSTRGAKPYLFGYYSKTIIGDAFDPAAVVGDAAPAEIVPVGKPGAVRFKVVARGKPVAGVDVNLVLPGGKTQKAPTDAQGLTPEFAPTGRYGAWTRCTEPTAGEKDGKKYDEVRFYPTLVAEIGKAAPGAKEVKGSAVDEKIDKAAKAAADHAKMADAVKPATQPTGPLAPISTPYPRMPEATSSFGAVAVDGWLYVYGGHIAKTHAYNTEAVSGKFHRIKLDGGTTWEPLAGGPGLQGMNLAAHAGKVYRVGGMQPRNKPGEKTDNVSVADVSRFDPAAGKWEALPPMPVPRSSHDVAVVGDKLVVVGGWNMKGRGEDSEWVDSALVMDLSAKNLAWKSVKQPFQRRALIAGVRGGKLYVLGGFPEESKPSRLVDVYDVAADKWSSGPELPGSPMNGFSPAACTVGDDLYVSVADGSLYRLDEPAGKEPSAKWVKVAATTPRIVHRLAPHGTDIVVVGGAAKGDNLDLVEVVKVGPAAQAVKTGEAAKAGDAPRADTAADRR